ncbi:hypothetical protein AYL99_09759 [Fonsecaea erecta]|uniref:Uncharacterized protein n=1 Tax=Fonsecaea erecta TaxID=1367422 RepID=A0A178Z750_9EURO|nr:hypothetical protein AYL99_09759 [Fonsecaea erecta]OAP55608.1 hypothetical protein AYL99_09759 [Fonsecaea erecta]
MVAELIHNTPHSTHSRTRSDPFSSYILLSHILFHRLDYNLIILRRDLLSLCRIHISQTISCWSKLHSLQITGFTNSRVARL